ncbi:MAG: hypothetical protein K2I05_01985 [Mailhella sp.]|nr:hypothetical protein [Mailhella sp.]
MTREQEKTLDVEIVEDSNAETQELAELNSYKNELIAKSREIDKETTSNTASILEIVGMFKAHKISEQFNKTLRTIKLREIKELKEYKGLTLLDINGQAVTVNSWEEFCKALGTSSKSVDRDIQNLNTFGQEFMQLSESIGLSYRELRRMRQNMQNPMLSEQEKLALEEAKGKDPQEMLTLLEDLQDKQAVLEEKINNLEEENSAKAELIAKKTKQNEKLELDLAKTAKESPENLKQAEKNRIFNSLDREFSMAVSNFQSLKAVFLEVLRMQEEGALDEDENARFEEGVLLFLTNAMRLLSEMRTKEYDFIQAVDKLGLLWLFVEYDKQTMPTFTLPEA